METVVVAAIIAVSFGAAATWLLATRLPESWLESSTREGRYAHLGAEDPQPDDTDPRRMQARNDARRVRRGRARRSIQSAAQMMRTLRNRRRDCALMERDLERNEKTRA